MFTAGLDHWIEEGAPETRRAEDREWGDVIEPEGPATPGERPPADTHATQENAHRIPRDPSIGEDQHTHARQRAVALRQGDPYPYCDHCDEDLPWDRQRWIWRGDPVSGMWHYCDERCAAAAWGI